MNKNKENLNSKKTVNQSKNNQKKINEISKIKIQVDSIQNHERSASRDKTGKNSRKSTNQQIIKEIPKDEENRRRKTVSPNITNLIPKDKSNVSSNKNFVNSEEIHPDLNISPNFSSIKRKYNEYSAESETEKNAWDNLEKSLASVWKEYKTLNTTWKEFFKNMLIDIISVLTENYSPHSLNSIGSKLMAKEEFWILWIENIEQHLSVEKLFDLFFESYDFIANHTHIMSYYISKLKMIEENEMKEYIKSNSLKLKELKYPSHPLFELLYNLEFYLNDFYVSTSSYINPEKKKKLDGNNIRPCQNFEMVINPMTTKEFNNSIIISSSQNDFNILSTIKQQETPITLEVTESISPNRINNSQKKDNEVIQHISFNSITKNNNNSQILKHDSALCSNLTTPRKELIETENKNKNNSSFKKSSLKKSAFKEEPHNSTSNQLNKISSPDSMKVSQIDQQITNYMNADINIIKPSQFNNSSRLNDSMQANITQDTQYQKIAYAQGDEYIINPGEITTQTIPLDDSNLSLPEGNTNSNMLEQSHESSLENIREEISKKKIDEETLDIIEDLNKNSVRKERNSILDISMGSNHSRSRSKSRGKNLQSILTEEYPNNIVEGSIRKFNQSFNGGFESESGNKSI